MVNDKDIKYLKMAIANSRESLDGGNFPAGAVVVKDDKILASEIRVPGLFHPDSIAVTTAFNKTGPLKGATLYVGLESCLMCTGVAYWSGLRRIVYAIPKSKVNGDYYETHEQTQTLVDTFNEPIERIHVAQLEEEAIAVIREWESKYLSK